MPHLDDVHCQLFVGNLLSNCSEADLATIFGRYGTIVDICVVPKKATSKKRGYGFITFEDSSVVDQIVAQKVFVVCVLW